ncbi:hypothetical protein R69888_01376 [Paraburkholderia haematera]|uniref:Uncharacterized protein n=1 Tax=Paraburkholderia haematera TaxID=2793077 RepID=A0ABN7L0S7_9BURK|nr:hypothetical protein R69888_01376 [Paraburkholderia haematera]
MVVAAMDTSGRSGREDAAFGSTSRKRSHGRGRTAQ